MVRRAPLFKALDDEAASALQSQMSRSRMERGDVLFHEGDRGDTLYVIAEGKIKLGRTSPDGRENLVAILGPGEMFGELSLFDPGPRTMTATAIAETQLLGLGNDSLTGLLSGPPRGRPRPCSRRSRSACAAPTPTSPTSSSPTCPGRVAKALLDLSERFGRPVEGGIMVSHDLTQEELAQLVGASRETVNKALADFATRGWLRLEARAVLLQDVERLKRRAR